MRRIRLTVTPRPYGTDIRGIITLVTTEIIPIPAIPGSVSPPAFTHGFPSGFTSLPRATSVSTVASEAVSMVVPIVVSMEVSGEADGIGDGSSMKPEGTGELRDAQPFVHFRICPTDGKAYDIPHRDFLMIGRTVIDIGIANDRNIHSYDQIVRISPLHIARVENLQVA